MIDFHNIACSGVFSFVDLWWIPVGFFAFGLAFGSYALAFGRGDLLISSARSVRQIF